MSIETRVVKLLRDIEQGKVTLKIVGRTPEKVFAGNVEYRSSNGWKLLVFNDCNDWDYLDSATSPDDEELDFDEMSRELQGYRPDAQTTLNAYQFKHDSAVTGPRCTGAIGDMIRRISDNMCTSALIRERMRSVNWTRFDEFCVSWMCPFKSLRERAIAKSRRIYSAEVERIERKA